MKLTGRGRPPCAEGCLCSARMFRRQQRQSKVQDEVEQNDTSKQSLTEVTLLSFHAQVGSIHRHKVQEQEFGCHIQSLTCCYPNCHNILNVHVAMSLRLTLTSFAVFSSPGFQVSGKGIHISWVWGVWNTQDATTRRGDTEVLQWLAGSGAPQ